MEFRRYRLWCFAIAIVFIGIGLYSRSAYPFPEFLKVYAGDVLWTGMVYFLVAFCCPKSTSSHLFISVLLFSFIIEFSQLLSTPLFNYLRTTFLRYVLGQGFVWSDFLCYILGAIVAYVIDQRLIKHIIKRDRSLL